MRKQPRNINRRIIVKLLKAGSTASEVGASLGLSKERICQLFFSETGIALSDYRYEGKVKLLQKASKALQEERKKVCLTCKQPFIKNSSGFVKYCSTVCRKKAVYLRGRAYYKEFSDYRKGKVR